MAASQTDEESERVQIFHDGEEEYYNKQKGDFDTREVVKVKCDTMDDAREVGKVVSLLKRHSADDIREAVEGKDDEQ